MKTITLVAFRRPDYTLETINSLRVQRNISDYHLFVAIEPGHLETYAVCRGIDFMDRTIEVNSTVLGVNCNNLKVYERAFDAGSMFNVAIEDDTPLAPDALRLAQWYATLPERDNYWLLNLFSGSRTYDRPLDVSEHGSFCPWGFCMSQTGFERIASEWMCDPRGWDWSICEAMKRKSGKALKPHLARSRNIGRTRGVYCTPEYYDACFGGNVCSDGLAVGDFRIVPN